MIMMSRKHDALHDLLNAVVMGIGAHKPNEYHILNLKTDKLRFVKGRQTVLPVLSPEERFNRLVWIMGGLKPDSSYESYDSIALEAVLELGGLIIYGESYEGAYVPPCQVAGVQGQLRPIARNFDALSAPTNERLANRLCTIINEAHRHHEDRVRTQARI